LASNAKPLGTSRAALKAMRKALDQVNLYPDGPAFYLRQKLAAKLGLAPGNLILGNGSNEIIEFLGHALLSRPPALNSQPSTLNLPASPVPEVIVSQYC